MAPIRDSFKFKSLSISVHSPSDLSTATATESKSSVKSSRYTFEHCPPNSSNPPKVNTLPSTQAKTWP